VTVDGAGHSAACSRLSASPPRRACVGARPVIGGGRSAVARSPCAHRFANPFPGPLRRNRAGMTAFAIRVGVALAVPWRGGRPATATHSPVARLDRACLIAGWIVKIRLDGRFCASQPTSDLGDRQTLLVSVVAGELRRATPFRDTVEHQKPQACPRCWTTGPSIISVRAVRRSFVSIRRVVEVGLDGRRRPAEPLGDLDAREQGGQTIAPKQEPCAQPKGCSTPPAIVARR
jgi:hypothetical protein